MREYTPEQLRRIDGLVEQHVFEHQIVCWDWPCGWAEEHDEYEASKTSTVDKYSAYDERGPVYIEPGTSDFWPPKPWLGKGKDWALVTPVPHYTTDWRHAGRVLERLVPKTYYGYLELTQNPQTKMWYSDAEPGGMGEGEGATLQLAICLHALAVAGVDVEKEVTR